MIFGKHRDVPREISAVGLDKWYSELGDRDRVKLSRYLEGCDTSSEYSFCISVMEKANADNGHPLAALMGEHALGGKPSDMQRFRILEELIVAYFEMHEYDRCFECCDIGLGLLADLRDRIVAENGGMLPERINCRSYKINVQVGIRFDYDGGDRTLDGYYESGLISKEDLEFRKQSHKIYRLQKSFDGIYSIKIKDE